jgi:tartrate dehydratase beta subunit/fumarate hydratase class I family protein
MSIPLAAPLSPQAVARLRAGDAVSLSGPLLLLNLRASEGATAGAEWLTADGEGSVCCLALRPADPAPLPAWAVARIDDPSVDRVACALLSAGARGLVCGGRCLATTSYALRKYGGVHFRVPPDWLALCGVAPLASSPVDPRSPVFRVTVEQAGLVVAQDAQGRQVEHDD